MLLRPTHPIDDDEVHVWHAFVADIANLDALHCLLDKSEIERAQGHRRQGDRQLYLLSRAVMRAVLASYLDCRCDELRFTANGFGKPILDGSPLFFNLTHSRGAVALAVSRREVGIDVEDRRREVEYHALAERYFAEAEARHLAPLRDQELRDAFFAIWTLKEAYVKAIGRGLSFPLDAFCFELTRDRIVGFRALADFVSCDWHFEQLDLSDHHRAALAVQTRGGAPTIRLCDWAEAFLPSSGGGQTA